MTIMAICWLGLFFDAFDSTILSVALPKLASEWKITPVQVGLLGSAGFIGMLIGAILFGIIADVIGRRKVFQITLLIYALLTGACALTNGFTSMFILRAAVGLGLGGLVPVDSAYVAEYVPSKRRGQFLSWLNSSFAIGNGFAFLVGFLVVVPIGWRWGFVIGIIPAIIVIFVRRTLPESVRYLVQKGMVTDAVKIVEGLERRVLKKTTVTYEEAVEREKLARSMSSEARVRIPDLFKGGLAKSTIMISTIWFCMNYSGYAILVWLPILLTKQLHYGLGISLQFLAIACFISLLGQISAGYCSDHLGRRPTITYSFIMYGLSVYFFFWFGKDPSVGAALLIIMQIFMGSCWGSVYAYSPENFPTRVRGTGLGFAGAIGRLGGILGPTIVGIIYSTAGLTWVLHINMILLIVAVIVMFMLGRETKGKTLEQITFERIPIEKVASKVAVPSI
jgi:putative MFS transporter